MPDRRTRVIGFALLAMLVLGLAACSNDKKLKVFGIDPVTGDFNGGQVVKIKGNGFQADGTPLAVKVFFGTRQASIIRFDGDSDLYVTAPGGKKNEAVDVLVVFQPGGESRLIKAFTYVEPVSVDVEDLGGGGSGSGSNK